MIKAPIPYEHDEQARVVRELRQAKVDGRRVLFCAVPNGVRSSMRQAVKLKREGLERHVPDLLIFTRSPANGKPTAIEMKRAQGGRVDPGQLQYLDDLSAEGWNTHICHGAADALQQLFLLDYI